MKPKNTRCTAGVSVLVIALIPPLHAEETSGEEKAAEDPAVTELVHPTNRIEIGLGSVAHDSAKFGEYNGLEKSGPYGIGNFDLFGGGAYDSNDATRWRLSGTDLGLETRELAAEYGVQGQFKVNLGYDELLRVHSDSYQTPYQGLGSNNLTLPANWLKPSVSQVSATTVNFRVLSPTVGPAGSLTNPTPTAPQLATGQSIRDADLPAFHQFDIATKRETFSAGVEFQLGRNWQLAASYRHEKKDGTKLINAISTKSTFESSVLLPDPINQITQQFNLALNYTSKRAFLQLAYSGSLFKNEVESLTWQDPSNLGVFSTQSSAPDNQFHQLNLTGGFNFSPTTRLVINAAYGRNTQNDAFLTDVQLPLGIPRSSLDGKVITKGFNLKLTARPVNGLNLSASYKFDDRDNRSPVNTYVFYDINVPAGAVASSFNTALGLPAGTLANNINIYANRPHSKRLHQFTVAGDFVVAKGQTLAAGYEFQKVERECKGTWIACEDADATRENTLHVEWRARVTDNLSSKITYAHAKRDVDYNIDAWLALAPMANVNPGAPTLAATTSAYGYMLQTGLSGWGPISGFPATPLTGDAAIFTPGNNIITSALYGSRNQLAENPRMRRFNVARRNRDKVRTSVNWEATEKLSLVGALDFNRDRYPNSPLGVQETKGWAFNSDGAYAVSDSASIGLFYTHEDQRSEQIGWNYIANAAAAAGTITGGCFATVAEKNLNNKVDPCNAWTAVSRERADTIGLTLQKKNLLGGKFDVDSSAVYTRARTNMAVRGGNYAVVPATTNLVYIPASDLPTVTSKILELRLSGQYLISTRSTVRMVYVYEQLRSEDFAYDAAQPGTLTTGMPSLEQAPRYSQHVIGLSYQYRFQ